MNFVSFGIVFLKENIKKKHFQRYNRWKTTSYKLFGSSIFYGIYFILLKRTDLSEEELEDIMNGINVILEIRVEHTGNTEIIQCSQGKME